MITVLSEPRFIEPVYSIDGHNLAHVIDSDNSALFSFKYVQEIYVDGEFITRTKVSPNIGPPLGQGKGVLQANRILEDFVSYDLHRQEGFSNAINSMISYDIVIGEESDGTLDGSGPGFEITPGPTFSGHIWNATLQYRDAYTFNDFLTGLTAAPKRFLTNAPKTQLVQPDENLALYFMNGLTAAAAPGPTISGTQVISAEIEVFGPTSSTVYYIFLNENIEPNTIVSLGIGPSDINRLVDIGRLFNALGEPVSEPVIDCDVIKYTVQLKSFTPVG